MNRYSMDEKYKHLAEIIKKRRSIRTFLQKKVEKEKITKIIHSARYAPSAGNLQPLEIIIVDDPLIKQEIFYAALQQESIQSAPVVLVICGDVDRTASKYGKRGRELYVIQDIATATQNILLTATSLGLGTVWVGAFDEDKIRRILQLPKNVRPFAIIPIGYYEKEPEVPYKRSIEEIIHYNTW